MGRSTPAHYSVHELRQLVARLAPGPAVDVGFGRGESLELLAELGHDPLYGYEIAEDLVEAARERLEGSGAELRLFVEDATPMTSVPDASVNLIVVNNAIQYFHALTLATTVRRVLRRGGHFVGYLPRPSYYLHPRHLKIKRGVAPWWLVSYPRSALRSTIFSLVGRQPLLGGSTPEIGWTRRSVERFAELGGLEIAQERKVAGNRRVVDLRRV